MTSVNQPRIQGRAASSKATTSAKAASSQQPEARQQMHRAGPSASDNFGVRKGVAPISRLDAIAANNPDADPMAHVNYLASKELLGRGSPSPGIDMAAAKIAELMKKYGMEGPNPGDPSGNPYYQTFDLWSLGDDNHSHITKRPWGRDLFEGGFYLDETLSADEKGVIQQQCQNRGIGGSAGQSNIAPRAVDLTPEALRQAGLQAAKVQNVMGVMRGTGPNKDEYIVLMAHMDHLGGTPDRWFPGASDNASGSGTNMSTIPLLAELQKSGKLDRSVLIIWSTAEEKGLVGANYFLKHPLQSIPLSQIKGSVNNDMVGRWEKDRISVIDTTKGKKTFLTDAFAYANEKLGDRKFVTVNRDLQQFENRQDNWAFTKAGITTAFLFEGLSNPAGGGGENEDYHRPTDTPDKIIRDNGGEKLSRMRDLTVHMLEYASNAKL